MVSTLPADPSGRTWMDARSRGLEGLWAEVVVRSDLRLLFSSFSFSGWPGEPRRSVPEPGLCFPRFLRRLGDTDRTPSERGLWL